MRERCFNAFFQIESKDEDKYQAVSSVTAFQIGKNKMTVCLVVCSRNETDAVACKRERVGVLIPNTREI